MWLRILKGVVYRNRGSFLLTLVSAVVGAKLVASLGSLASGISAKIGSELKSYGANIIVKPSGVALLSEDDLVAVKSSIFWRYNIVGVTPFLHSEAVITGPAGSAQGVVSGTWFDKQLPVESDFRTGLKTTAPYLSIEGTWPSDTDAPEVVLGRRLATRLGSGVGQFVLADIGGVSTTLTVTGVMESGGVEDDAAYVPLAYLQSVSDRQGLVSQALVSAVTTPLDDFGRRDPTTMTRREYDKWYCTAYVTSVAKQIEETVKGSTVRPVWKVAEAEGAVLGQLSWLIYALVALAMVAATLAVSTTLMGNVMRRRGEIGLLKAIGGESRQVASIFLVEAGSVGLLAGFIGWGLGSLLADYLGLVIFGTPFEFGGQLFVLSIAVSLLVTIVGAWVPLREGLRVPAGEVMRG